VTLALARTSTSGQVARLQRMSGLQEDRLALSESRCDIRWLIGRGKTPTLCVIPLFSVAAMEKCCDACGDEEYYFMSGSSASQAVSISEASIAVDRKSMVHTVAGWSRKDADYLCIFSI
jgi:hypothetical protein